METKQIINGLLDRADRMADQSAGRIMKQAAERLRELDRSGKWVSVKEELPKRNGDYLVCTQHPFYMKRNIAKANFRNNAFYGQGGCWHNVTHWMVLPKEPKGESK